MLPVVEVEPVHGHFREQSGECDVEPASAPGDTPRIHVSPRLALGFVDRGIGRALVPQQHVGSPAVEPADGRVTGDDDLGLVAVSARYRYPRQRDDPTGAMSASHC